MWQLLIVGVTIHIHEGVIAANQLYPNTTDGGSESTYANTTIPLSIWDNRFHCKDYNQCVAQNGSDLGALHITNQLQTLLNFTVKYEIHSFLIFWGVEFQ